MWSDQVCGTDVVLSPYEDIASAFFRDPPQFEESPHDAMAKLLSKFSEAYPDRDGSANWDQELRQSVFSTRPEIWKVGRHQCVRTVMSVADALTSLRAVERCDVYSSALAIISETTKRNLVTLLENLLILHIVAAELAVQHADEMTQAVRHWGGPTAQSASRRLVPARERLILARRVWKFVSGMLEPPASPSQRP